VLKTRENCCEQLRCGPPIPIQSAGDRKTALEPQQFCRRNGAPEFILQGFCEHNPLGAPPPPCLSLAPRNLDTNTSRRPGLCEQDPKARPSAKYLQQHKFVVNARQAAATSLVPLIKQSRDLLAQMGEDSPVTLPGAR